jgi:hypothetical protein
MCSKSYLGREPTAKGAARTASLTQLTVLEAGLDGRLTDYRPISSRQYLETRFHTLELELSVFLPMTRRRVFFLAAGPIRGRLLSPLLAQRRLYILRTVH